MSKNNNYNNEDEVVEEEFSERDEYDYDDGYDDGYGEYDDYYDEEGYAADDYGQTYENERLNQVLDNLASLKRALRPSQRAPRNPGYDVRPQFVSPSPNVQNQSIPNPQNPQVLVNVPHTGLGQNDVAIYNEISQLRSDIARTQGSQEILQEVTRAKEQMHIEGRQNEQALLNKLDVLESKFDSIAKNEEEREGEAQLRGELSKLIDINANILELVRESDDRSTKQVADLKRRVLALPEFSELKESLDDLKERFEAEVASKLESVKTEDISRVQESLEEIKETLREPIVDINLSDIEEQVVLAARKGVEGFDVSELSEKINTISKAANKVSSCELLRQLYEIKVLVGSQSEVATNRNKELLELYNDFNKVKFEVDSSYFNFADKLFSIDSFARKLTNCAEPEAFSLHQALLSLTEALLREPLTAQNFSEVLEFSMSLESVRITQWQKENIEAYFKLIERSKETIYDPDDFLASILNTVNAIQGHKNSTHNEKICSEVSELAKKYTNTKSDTALLSQIQLKIAQVCNLTIGDVLTYAPERPSKFYKSSPSLSSLSLVDQLNELKDIIAASSLDKSLKASDDPQGSVAQSSAIHVVEDIKASIQEALSLEALQSVASEITYTAAQIRESLQSSGLFTSEEAAALIDKLDAQDEFLQELKMLRADIAALSLSSRNSLKRKDQEELSEGEDQQDEVEYTEIESFIIEQTDSLYNGVAVLLGNYTEPLGDTLNSVHSTVTQIASDIAEIKAKISSGVSAYDSPATVQRNEVIEREIEQMRAILEDKENFTSEALQEKIAVLLDEVASIKDDLHTQDMPSAESTINGESISLSLEEISVKLNTLLYGTVSEDINEDADNIQVMLADLSDIKDKLYALDDATIAILDKVMDRQPTDSEVKTTIPITGDRVVDSGPKEEIVLILEDLTSIKERLIDSNAQIESVKDQILSTRARESAELSSELDKITSELKQLKLDIAQISDIKKEISGYREDIKTRDLDGVANVDSGIILDEIVSLREDVTLSSPSASSEDVKELKEEMASIKGLLESLISSGGIVKESGGEAAVVDESSAIRNTEVLEEIASLKEQIAILSEAVSAKPSETTNDSTEAINNLVVAVEEVKQQIQEPDTSIVSEILSLREDISVFKQDVESSIENLSKQEQAVSNSDIIAEEVKEQVAKIEEKFETVKDEIKDSVLEKNKNKEEIVALISSLQDENKKIRETLSENEKILVQVQELRDQLFAISMAQIAKEDGQTQFESYNNLILDKLSSIGNELNVDILKSDIAANLVSNEKMSEFMGSVASLIEKQNARIEALVSQDATLQEIKNEIAAAAYQESMQEGTEEVLSELRNLKQSIALLGRKEEISAEATRKAISRQDRELDRTVGDLKSELNQIADILAEKETVKPEPVKKSPTKKAGGTASTKKSPSGAKKPAPKKASPAKPAFSQATTAKKNTTGKTTTTSTTKKSGGSKEGSNTRRTTTTRQKPAETETAIETQDDLLSKINRESSDILQLMQREGQADAINTRTDDMDVAARLARQVANKLVMEQLVQQLGDGGVPQSKVEEIVKEILPHEFTTIQIDEQSDSVRRLANSLVLDKLRARLTGKK